MTPFKTAWDNFVGSDEYHEAIDPLTLDAQEKMRVYLENRISRAFSAGWNARDKIVSITVPNRGTVK